MNAAVRLADAPAAPFGLKRALDEAEHLLLAAEAHGVAMAELGPLDLPPPARADAMQLRAIASLYLASTLEAAGLIQAADDFTRLARTGALPGDLGEAAQSVETFWEGRGHRIGEADRLALFGRLFGAPAGPDDAAAPANGRFEELLLDLCDAIIKAADGGSQGQVRVSGVALAENIADAASDMVQMMAREILDALGQAIAILNHQQVRAVLHVRTMWDAVASIDQRFRRARRPTLTHLRRGRAGMAVLAWLADVIATLEQGGGAPVSARDSVIDAAVDWVDETLSIVRGDAPAAAPGADAAAPVAGARRAGTGSDWRDLGR
ncbi:MAG TPA: hypothetical protein VGD66_13640 [Allosphingosinicella sp.]|jgi:hypothetical protein